MLVPAVDSRVHSRCSVPALVSFKDLLPPMALHLKAGLGGSPLPGGWKRRSEEVRKGEARGQPCRRIQLIGKCWDSVVPAGRQPQRSRLLHVAASIGSDPRPGVA